MQTIDNSCTHKLIEYVGDAAHFRGHVLQTMGQGHVALPSKGEESHRRNSGGGLPLLLGRDVAISKGKFRLVPIANRLRRRPDVLNVDPPLRPAPLVHLRRTFASVLPGLLLQGPEALLDSLDDLLGRLFDELHLLSDELIGIGHAPVRGELVANVVLRLGLVVVVFVCSSSSVVVSPSPLAGVILFTIVTSTLGTALATTVAIAVVVSSIVPLGVHDLAILGLALGVIDETQKGFDHGVLLDPDMHPLLAVGRLGLVDLDGLDGRIGRRLGIGQPRIKQLLQILGTEVLLHVVHNNLARFVR